MKQFRLSILTTVIYFILNINYGESITEVAAVESQKNVEARNSFAESYVLYGVLKTAVDVMTNSSYEMSTCLHDGKMLMEAIDSNELWAVKVLDASGNPMPSFIYGNNFWTGSKSECERLNAPFRINVINPKNPNLADQIAPFPMEYVLIFANFTEGYQYTPFGRQAPLLHIGLCLPRSCSTEEVKSFAQTYFRSAVLNIQRLYKLNIKIVEVRKQSWSHFISRSETQTILYCIFANLFVVVFLNIFRGSEKSLIRKLSHCFDLEINFKNLMSTSSSTNSLIAVDSLRFIACLLIMGGHMIYFSTIFATNGAEMVVSSYKLRSQLFYLMPFFVDIFFHIGAMLVVYNFLRNEKQILRICDDSLMQNVLLFAKLLLNRYLRLTPSLLITMALSHLTALYLKDVSPYYVTENQDLYCKSNFWWRNLLYIQGYFSNDDMCACWVWYLSADMQYYVLTLLGLFIYAKGRKFMVTLSYCVLLIASIAYSFNLSTRLGYKFYLENFKQTENILYINPTVRIIPYLSGIATGVLLNFGKFPDMLPTYLSKFWLLCSMLLLASFSFGMMHRDQIPQIVFSAANSVVRFIFVQITVGLIIFINYFGKAGSVGTLLSHRIFVHLSKLTYMMYLMQPIIIYLYHGNIEKPYNFSILNIYVEFFGILAITYVVSVFGSIIFEIPYIKMSQVFLMKRKSG